MACRLVNTPGGCRFGNKCKFSHTIGPSGQTRQSSQRESPAPRSSGGTPRGNCPPGVCSFYWTSGHCNRGSNCRFKHETRPSAGPPDGNASSSIAQPVLSLLSDAGLAKLMDSGTDVLFAGQSPQRLGPTVVHGRVKQFLADDYRFSTSMHVYAFVSLLSSASATDPSWTQEEGLLLLKKIADGSGLNRIADVIQWQEVSSTAGSSSTVLSFQRGYVPLLQYMTSEFVVKSTLSHLVNALYMLVMNSFDQFADVIENCMTQAMNAHSFADPKTTTSRRLSGSQVLSALGEVLFECLTRFKNAVVTHPRLRPLVYEVSEWMEKWTEGISANPPTFDDPFRTATPEARNHIIRHLKLKVDRIVNIVDREQGKVERSIQSARPLKPAAKLGDDNEHLLAALITTYCGPGAHREDGPRHDNDFVEIEQIRLAPTHGELNCRIPPFLPANFHGAPHPLPDGTMEKILDIQFRLLREELTAPLRSSIQLVLDDLSKRGKTILSELMKKKGGRYRGQGEGRDTVMFNVYTNVAFNNIVPDSRRGISISMMLDAPPGKARHQQGRVRAGFWESGKRLMQGGLIALVWKTATDVHVHLGTISSGQQDLTQSAKSNLDQVSVRIIFFDTSVELRILDQLKQSNSNVNEVKLLVEAPVMFEAIRPFLTKLQEIQPESVPLSRYLVHHPIGFLRNIDVDAPAYARVPKFSFALDCLFSADANVRGLKMAVSNPESVAAARKALREASRLDPSQADAVVDALTRELALIQGPPGTGKSYTGVELLRVLVANRVGPILLIALTNHALDHLLNAILDADITKRVVRLGSRSADERISKFSIETLEQVSQRTSLDRAFARNYRDVKLVEEELQKVMQDILSKSVPSLEIVAYLETNYPVLYEGFYNPLPWIAHIHKICQGQNDGWQRADSKGRAEEIDGSLYAFWMNGSDLELLETSRNAISREDGSIASVSLEETVTSEGAFRNPFSHLSLAETQNSDDEDCEVEISDSTDAEQHSSVEKMWKQAGSAEPRSSDLMDDRRPLDQFPSVTSATEQNLNEVDDNDAERRFGLDDVQNFADFFAYFGYEDIPQIPSSHRSLPQLLGAEDIWSFSMEERARMHNHFETEARLRRQEERMAEFESLRQRHADALKCLAEGKDEVKRQLLRDIDIIGATTTGAAKLTSMLAAIGPRVLVVEEAGQVLEAHILGSLTKDVQHCILIGDPLQLRPTLNNYALSMDNRRGRDLFRFDMSLMERLSTSGLPMSQIDVQRRMRPEISHLIRCTLYPNLRDHDLVRRYSDVRGFAKNVFFMTHGHKENGGGDESSSKFNDFEVSMIVDLVLYLLRQGTYSEEGDIVVLCGYLGQLAKLRDALAGKVAVVIDDRDQAELAEKEEERDVVDVSVERVSVSKQVRIRTIDNYQGEEAKIVILSLVRNSGDPEAEEGSYGTSDSLRANIGFLKSENRTNVALSRAKEGLFILGNAHNLSTKSNMWRKVIDELERKDCVGPGFPISCHQHPESLQVISSPGQLSKVAPDGGCLRPCNSKLRCGHLCPYKCHPDDPQHVTVDCNQSCTRLCSRGHPCDRTCAEPCGNCRFPIYSILLPCGHVKDRVSCHQLDDLESIRCLAKVSKALPTCEHTAVMACHFDPAEHACKALCNKEMDCCSKACSAPCHECQKASAGPNRESHRTHPCQRTLFCEHRCQNACSIGHECTTQCREPCRQQCQHSVCRKGCSTLCAPCLEACDWTCAHYSCPVPCGSACARLPCDQRCSNVLQCGHQCSSVCGEDCAIQICPSCTSDDRRGDVVDMIMGTTLGDIDSSANSLDQLLITLPHCRHVFTVETLDGICDLATYYNHSVGEDGTHIAWSSLRTAPSGFMKPPMCPTCRAAITAPRYGRVYKRADLDILERNVASHMSKSLAQVHAQIGPLLNNDRAQAITEQAQGVSISQAFREGAKGREKARRDFLASVHDNPCPLKTVEVDNFTLFDIPSEDIPAWKQLAHNLLSAYGKAVNIASKRSAHIHAWEAAFTSLYHAEVQRAVQDPNCAPRNLEEHAMQVARNGVGQPRPLADSRYRVEAFWATMHIRFTLANLANAWLKGLLKSAPTPLPEHCLAWTDYIVFVLQTSAHDGRLALEIAHASGSHRQATKTSLLLLRCDLELFRFDRTMAEASGLMKDLKEGLLDAAVAKRTEAGTTSREVITQHRSIPRRDIKAEDEWLRTEFVEGAKLINQEWQAIEDSIRRETFYEPMSLAEKMDIVKALDFGYTGHWYNCPNGHTFIITECGGAMEAAVCNECGEAIGGNNHNLLQTNSRAHEFEDMTRRGGAQEAHWPWGRD